MKLKNRLAKTLTVCLLSVSLMNLPGCCALPTTEECMHLYTVISA